MKGPEKIYCCTNCEYFKPEASIYFRCLLLDDGKPKRMYHKLPETPKDCPYLLKEHRKNKLKQINNET